MCDIEKIKKEMDKLNREIDMVLNESYANILTVGKEMDRLHRMAEANILEINRLL